MRGITYTISPERTGRLAYAARIGDVPQAQDTRTFGCLSWPACCAGGTLCPDPQGFGASLNPCCHFAAPAGPCPDGNAPQANTDGSYGAVGAAADSFSNAAQAAVSGSIPTWVIGAATGLAAFAVLRGMSR